MVRVRCNRNVLATWPREQQNNGSDRNLDPKLCVVHRIGSHLCQPNEQDSGKELEQGAVGDARRQALRGGRESSEIATDDGGHAKQMDKDEDKFGGLHGFPFLLRGHGGRLSVR